MITPANSVPVISPLALAGVDAFAGLGGELISTTPTVTPPLPNVIDLFGPASIVDLSAQAQLLSASASVATSVATSAAQSENLAVSQANAGQENIALLNAAAQAQLNEDINATQYAALIANEANLSSTALQGALADAALSDAIAQTAVQDVLPEATLSLPLTDTVTQTAVQSALADTELSNALAQTAVPNVGTASTPGANVAGSTNNNANPIPGTVLPTIVTNPDMEIIDPLVAAAIAAADPTVAAAIAAYHMGDGFFSTATNQPTETQSDTVTDVEPIPATKASALDLHDSARDDVANGVAWNWMRVNPVQKKFSGH